MKVHLNLATRDLEASVAFYSTLLAAKPMKKLPDHALFVTEAPGLELALDLDPFAFAAPGQHLGLVVDTANVVDEQIARLRMPGTLPISNVGKRVATHLQTKVWSSDPEGRRWETYVVLAETEQRDRVAAVRCCQ